MDLIKGVAPVRESLVFGTLDRIDNKISSLQSKLEPVICSVPTSNAKDIGGDTELLRRLIQIEDAITYTLDSVQL